MPPYLTPPPDGVPWLTLLVLWPMVGLLLIGLGALSNLSDRVVKQGVVAWMTGAIGLAAVV